MRTTRASISSAVRGRPGERWAVLLYFWAISFRCPSQQGLRGDDAGDLGKSFSSQRFGLYGQSPALIVIEMHSPATELFAKHPILLAEIFNDLQLAVVHPPEDGDQ